MTEVPECERQYMPHVFDALRALTVDVNGARVHRDELGEAVCRWLIRQNRPTVPKGALNRIMRRAGYPRQANHFRNIQLKGSS
ncbi:hypothetical protein [Streptomyces sp. NPDC094149]|uniref:hypothetical protein n=1 Tax=Streptomyces sp. NPDC094149 TaxID=3155079 RepID=UPI00331C3AB0